LKVLLVDVDSVWFNLALMKLSSWHKCRGDYVYLIRLPRKYRRGFGKPLDLTINSPMRNYDRAYVSCIFSENAPLAKGIVKMLESLGVEVELGGSGVDLKSQLPNEVEHIMPDYDLYGLNYSVGFITRGCIRSCPWCIVPLKEGKIRFNAPLKEFLHPRHRKVMLLDNNLLAYDGHIDVLRELALKRLMVSFNQGLDIRLIENENAKWLSHIKYRDDQFKAPRLYFSWDILNIESEVYRGIEILRKHGIPGRHMMFYMLCGYNVKREDYTWDYFMGNDYYRFQVLRRLGVMPYVMKYNGRNDIPLLNHFARYVNRHLYNTWTFQEYLKHKRSKLALNDEEGGSE